MIRRTRTGVELVIELPRAWRKFLQRRQRQLQPQPTPPFMFARRHYISEQALQQVRSRIAVALDHGASR